MKTVAVVPLKLNNERLPGKNLKSFTNGKPLLTYMLNTLCKVQNIDEIYVYCSSEEVKEYLPEKVIFLKRDPKYNSASTLFYDWMKAFTEEIEADIYVLAHVTAPFVKAENIQLGVEKLQSGIYDSALTVTKLQEFLWKNDLPFNYSLDKIPRTQDLPPMFTETTGVYAFTKDVFLRKKSRIGDHPFLVEVSKIEACDINEPIDFEIADAIFQILNKKKEI